MSTWRTYLVERVSLDLRALALFRIALSAYVLVQLCVRGSVSQYATSFMPLDLTVPWSQALAASALFLSLMAFGMGYKTRWSALLLWLAYALFHMGPLADGYRILTCAVLLLCVFLPVSRYVSLDDAMDRGASGDDQSAPVDTSVVSVATATALLFVLGYIATVIVWTAEFPQDTQRWHLAAGLLVLASPLLPRSLDLLRIASIMVFVAAMIAQAINVGSIPAVSERALMVVMTALLLPARVFDWIDNSAIFSGRHELRIYYDEPCGFCRKICYIFASFLMLGRCRIATAQSDSTAHQLLKDNDSWVVFDGDDQYELCWAALLKLMRASPVWWPLGWLLTLTGMGTWGKPLYRLIGRSRSLLSKLTAVLLPYTAYRIDLRAYEKMMIAVWGLLLLTHYSGAGALMYDAVPDALEVFGFGVTR